MAATFCYSTHDSAIGRLLMVGSARGMHYLTLLSESADVAAHLRDTFGERLASGYSELPGFFASTVVAIDRYLAGNGPLKLPYELIGGTPLQRAVWLAIARIPYGETISYSQLAERVGFPRAVRAVASACGANPVPLLIPCHRVLAKDGSLGGFSLGGVDVKEYLLQVEARQQQAAA